MCFVIVMCTVIDGNSSVGKLGNILVVTTHDTNLNDLLESNRI